MSMHGVHMWLIVDIQASLMLAWLESISESALRHSSSIWALKIHQRPEITAMFGVWNDLFQSYQSVFVQQQNTEMTFADANRSHPKTAARISSCLLPIQGPEKFGQPAPTPYMLP